ncbi:AAA family ATPase [Luteolibacter sp. SL250]|uniref:AAA family ATPase n=1 Tax=Luteolibacter sp. SL250 TaxID=2995170 RepID=UPI0022711E57|nr:AAA family ATPase [Luteolibacter sp. SL250]WAC19017.1 AAA family ATPase [Luteolibacter sp. SL250]
MSSPAISSSHILPAAPFERLYDHLHFDTDLKKRLVSQIVLTFLLRSKFRPGDLPVHGIILLHGPPGTGKTSVAKAVASKAASIITGKKPMRLLEIDPHALTGSALGKSQKEVMKLFRETIVEEAAKGPLIVLLDEVETMAASRQKVSMEANPLDVHRATDAVLTGLDAIASTHPEIIFICTSNFQQALDEAFVSRTDFMTFVDVPGDAARHQIIDDTLKTLGSVWNEINTLRTQPNLKKLVKVSKGMDGRAICKRILLALSLDTSLASNPGSLTIGHLETVFSENPPQKS